MLRHRLILFSFALLAVFLARASVARSSGAHVALAHDVCSSVHYRYSPGDLDAISSAVAEASLLYSVDPHLVLSVIVAESGCRVKAKSPKGAVGPMQLMPATAEWLGVQNPEEVRENILGGTRYLAYLLKIWNGDLELAVASYNAGPNAVRRYGAIPPYPETTRYVERVLEHYRRLSPSSEPLGYSRT